VWCCPDDIVKAGKERKAVNKRIYIVAEIGSNHNNNWDCLERMVVSAKQSGADAVKFQVFTGKNLYSRQAEVAEYLVREGKAKKGEKIADILDALALDRGWIQKIKSLCDQIGIDFLATPFDADAIQCLENVCIKKYKISSTEINNHDLLIKISETKKKLIVSTGMSSLGEIDRAVQLLQKHGSSNITLLHCTASYPTDIFDANMLAMNTLRETFQLPVGFSDHTTGNTAAILSVGLGAAVIEKHFTLDKDLPGPDHFFALNPDELTGYVQDIRDAEKALGSPRIVITDSEQPLTKYKVGLILKRAINKGDTVRREDIVMKRPSSGIPSAYFDIIVGRKVNKKLPKDYILTWNDFFL
jgi:N,N'-diacetyllegionaminate synthase